jgi:fatty acid desaturase
VQIQIKPIYLLLIQTVLIFAQIINAGLAIMQDVPGWVTMVCVALVGCLTFFCQHVGNGQIPIPITLEDSKGKTFTEVKPVDKT